MDNNISTNNAPSQNGDRNGKNKYQNSSVSLPTNDHSINIQIIIGNDNNSDSENENNKCWICFKSICMKIIH